MRKIRDRDYILDSDGNYLKVVGDIHPKGCVVSYVKYFPSEYGTRLKMAKDMVTTHLYQRVFRF